MVILPFCIWMYLLCIAWTRGNISAEQWIIMSTHIGRRSMNSFQCNAHGQPSRRHAGPAWFPRLELLGRIYDLEILPLTCDFCVSQFKTDIEERQCTRPVGVLDYAARNRRYANHHAMFSLRSYVCITLYVKILPCDSDRIGWPAPVGWDPCQWYFLYPSPHQKRPKHKSVAWLTPSSHEPTLVMMTISSRGRLSVLMAFPSTISDAPFEYT